MEKWQYVQSIYQKLITKCPVGTLKNATVKPNNMLFPLKYYITRFATSDHNDNGGNNGFRICSQNYNTAIQATIVAGAKFLNFNTEQERYNAWQSYLTKFARFCIAMDESTKLAPYMDDYTQPWTDERFKEYFELTDEEWKVIDETIK